MAGIKAILKKIEEAMAAAAFAEAGELESARQMIGSGKTSNKRVLLGVEQENFNESMIRNAMQLSQRLGGKLEIFHIYLKNKDNQFVSPADRDNLLEQYRQRFQQLGVFYQCLEGEGCLAEAITTHMANRRDILCVVMSDRTKESSLCQDATNKMMAFLQKIKCPVVVYSAT